MTSRNSDQKILWQEHLDKYKASGLSRQAYCREHGLKAHQLTYQLDRRSRNARAAKNSAFARVVAASVSTPTAPRCTARLVFGGGIVLEIDSGADPVWLARVVANVGGYL